MTDDEGVREPRFAEWLKLPPAKQALAWERIAPGTFKEIWSEALREGEHRRRIEARAEAHRIELEARKAIHDRRVAWFLHVTGAARIILAFGALIVSAIVAHALVGKGAVSQAILCFGIGGGSTVTLFLGAKPAVSQLMARGAKPVSGLEKEPAE